MEKKSVRITAENTVNRNRSDAEMIRGGTTVYCPASEKAAGSIPDGVIGTFH